MLATSRTCLRTSARCSGMRFASTRHTSGAAVAVAAARVHARPPPTYLVAGLISGGFLFGSYVCLLLLVIPTTTSHYFYTALIPTLQPYRSRRSFTLQEVTKVQGNTTIHSILRGAETQHARELLGHHRRKRVRRNLRAAMAPRRPAGDPKASWTRCNVSHTSATFTNGYPYAHHALLISKQFIPIHPPNILSHLPASAHLGPVDPSTLPKPSVEDAEEEARIAKARSQLPEPGAALNLQDIEV